MASHLKPVAGGAAATASPATQPRYTMTQDEYDEIRLEIWCEPWKDPQLFPDLLVHLVAALGALAMRPVEQLEDLCAPHPVVDDDAAAEWATDLLRECFGRARSGVPFGEPETVWGDLGPTNPKDV
ncbi:hypothetical protein ACXJJ3_26750 [Kribbella sp. WER1]